MGSLPAIPPICRRVHQGEIMAEIQKSHKGFEYINIQIIDPAPNGWMGHKPVYKEQKEGDKSKPEIDFDKTPVLPIIRLQAEKMIQRGQAVEYKPKKKAGRPPSNKKATATNIK
jgi:hypothetical protein